MWWQNFSGKEPTQTANNSIVSFLYLLAENRSVWNWQSVNQKRSRHTLAEHTQSFLIIYPNQTLLFSKEVINTQTNFFRIKSLKVLSLYLFKMTWGFSLFWKLQWSQKYIYVILKSILNHFKSLVWKRLKHKIKELLFAECLFIPWRKTVKNGLINWPWVVVFNERP